MHTHIAYIYPIILIVSILFANVAQADENTNSEAVLAEKRAAFLRIEKQVWNTSDADFADLVVQLGDYPLVPYLIEKKILHGLTTRKAEQVSAFLKEYENTPLERRVLRTWLRYLAKKNRKSLFLASYQYIGDTKLSCRHFRYQLEDGVAIETLYPALKQLWNVGKSQPKDCDPLFKLLKDNNQITPELILARISKAAQGGQHTLIPYLTKLLPSEQQYLGKLWHKVRRDPSSLRRLNAFAEKYPEVETAIISYGLGRLIWRDKSLALRTWKKAEEKFTFSAEHKAHIANRFAISLAIANHEKAEQWLIESESLEQDPEVLRWHLAILLNEQNWSSIINLIEKASPVLTSKNDYQYWLARSYEAMNNGAKAKELYQQLANERHYYGFLASARLGQAVSLQDSPLLIEREVLDKVASLPSAKRARELKELGRFHEARLEWRYAQRQLSEQEKLASAVLATEWEWHDQAIFTFSNTGYLDDVDRRFPMAFADVITREAQRYKIDPEWAFAIARRESSFMTDAVSSARAFGLMQVLPSTAKYLEKKRVSERSLMRPEVNAKLGNKYLRYLMDKVDNNTVLATASYNAGWRRVRGWLPENDTMEADLWVETIPFKETRNYVKAVLAYKQIYQNKLYQISDSDTSDRKPGSVFADFVQMQIPSSVAD